jgi:cell division protein FtsN
VTAADAPNDSPMTSRSDRNTPRPTPAVRKSRHSGAGGTLLGVFIGLALGLGLAAGVAFYLMRAGNPYQPSTAAREAAREGAKEPSKLARTDSGAVERPRFDFYKILPGIEDPTVQAKGAERPAPDKATAERAASPEKAVAKSDERPTAESPVRAPKSVERFWVQAGSFAAEADAENLKARLALAGWEAAVQAVTLPEKGVRYRVRLGPYGNAEELNRVKGDLAKRGFEVAVVKY